MASFYELSEEEAAAIVAALKFQRDRTWGEFLEIGPIELADLLHYLETRERR